MQKDKSDSILDFFEYVGKNQVIGKSMKTVYEMFLRWCDMFDRSRVGRIPFDKYIVENNIMTKNKYYWSKPKENKK